MNEDESGAGFNSSIFRKHLETFSYYDFCRHASILELEKSFSVFNPIAQINCTLDLMRQHSMTYLF